MLNKPPHGLFITGTDTEVGKTYVATLIVKELVAAGHRVGVYKPVASDCVSDGRQLVSEDAVALWEAAGRPLSLDFVCPNRYQAPLAPHLSARHAGRELDTESMRKGLEIWTDECDIVVVEGAGGLMSPISDDEYFADLAYDFGYPSVVVTPNVIGAINQCLSALITATCFRDGIPLAGSVLNDARSFDGDISMESNREQIASRAMAPVISRLRYEGEKFDDDIDWMEIAKNPVTQEAREVDIAAN
ncbi:MAG: dethiobiotin synthase [Mariniblastus sp.]|nr:dethiobiotin synthase [Mariniblastus sp.]